ncbi:MAG: phosphoethanolamine--lipid A transferase [Steroidobacteraceae bacterium]
MPTRSLTPNRLCALAAIWIVLVANGAFWKLLFQVQGTGIASWPFAVSLFIALTGLNLLMLRLLSPGRALRPMLSLLLLLAVAAGWFMDTYGVALDSQMLRNVYETNPAEARDFLGWPLWWRLLWQAGLPIAFIWWVPLPLQGWWRATRDWVLASLAGLALVLLAALPMYSSYVSWFRNQHSARYLLAPVNVVVGSTRLLRKSLATSPPHEQLGLDARRAGAAPARPLLVVLVIGETARAANFSLGGYARDTNPLLARRGVYYFSDVTACGTSTAVSLPCMFSGLPREEFELAQAAHRDSVLDVLQRAGLAVRWIDNQSGCKKVCDRVPNEPAQGYYPAACRDGECLDETLLRALDARLPQVGADGLLVLHAMGSHGPAYYRRVPADGVAFQPTCATQRIETCSDAEIVNAYDNSLRYTDYVLDGLIERLASASDRIDSVLLYVSDHGESLGERGLYLHGQPWLLAPEVQKKVPMLLWFSAAAPSRLQLDTACLRGRLGAPASHDNLAPTLLGLADVQTAAYRPALDLLRACRGGG